MDFSTLAAKVSDVAQLSGEFRLRSGMTSTTYFDKYQFESDPHLLQAIAERMVDLVPADTEILAGLELGGVPIATALSFATGLPAVFVRKKAKEYGTAKLAEGPSIDRRRLLIVEDVVTTGGQIVISAADLRDGGAIIDSAVCAIDRGQGGADALEAADITLMSVFTTADIER